MSVEMNPIGYVQTDEGKPPRHWTVSNMKGRLIIDEQYKLGLMDIHPGDQIVVLFHFHESPPFDPSFLRRKPSHHKEIKGVFSLCSPVRPNPIGLSVLDVLKVEDTVISVKGLDMTDGTPILDLKPHVIKEKKHSKN